VTTIEDQRADLGYETLDAAYVQPLPRHRHYQRRRRGLRLTSVLLLCSIALMVGIGGALIATRQPAHPAIVKLHTTVQTSIAPAPTPSVPPTTVAPGSAFPATVQVSPGVTEPNPLRATIPGVNYAPPAYPGAIQAGVGPEGPIYDTPSGNYQGLVGCALYVGGQQIGEQFPGKVNGVTYQCNPDITPASIPRHP
jgi:hypothetical protein